MYRVVVSGSFSSAHYLRGYKGKCEKLHGHNWKIEVEVEGEELDKKGLLIDFKKLKKILNNILNELDHRNLNEVPYFKKKNPSSENIAFYVYKKMKEKIKGLKIVSVSCWEKEDSKAIFIP
ncbi:MAG: 6-carboxytetrahydropterin synthase QueD [Caldiserica bacterium]|nr:MAG: 6-carboxytetrahydropterin synthase QueD [Caldisericota bacterium]